jgi:hypothetical protein
MGSHSKLPLIQTVFGSHSKPAKKQKIVFKHGQDDLSTMHESAKDLSKEDHRGQTEIHSAKDENKIHSDNKTKENNALFRYTEGSRIVNKSLYNLHAKKQKPSNADHIKQIDQALNSEKIKHDTHVFTGLSRDPREHWSKNNKNKPVVVHHPAYISTSTKYSEAHFFAEPDLNDHHSEEHHKPLNHDAPKLDKDSMVQHVLKIHVPAGTHGGSVSHQSEHPHENEILLHRGHDIEIHHQPTIHPDGTHVWHGRIVNHNPKQV